MKAKVPILVGVTAATVGLIAVTIMAQDGSIVGSKHDFSAFGWSEGQICLPCHTPHGADTTVASAPLWNHEVTQATYTLYGGGTAPYDQALDPTSILCMSCHDGTVALDSFGGKSGTIFMTGDALLGTDLSDDHPVGLTGVYPIEGTSKFKPEGALTGTRLLTMEIDGVPTKVVGCRSCHSGHNTVYPYMLRMPIDGSALCLDCHIK